MEIIYCPFCGQATTLKELKKEHRIIARVKNCPGGYKKLQWRFKDSGWNWLKRELHHIWEIVGIRLDPLDGCDFFPECLYCPRPLEDCPNEKNWSGRTLKNKPRNEDIKKARASGKTTKQIAADTGLSVRTIERTVKKEDK